MDMENIKKAVKESIVQNFMEAAKFARRGAEKQRPKSWSKGTKSGSDKRKMREEGKRQSDPREVYEESNEWDQRTSDAYDAWLLPKDEPKKPGKDPQEEKRKDISNAVYDWVSETGLHSHFGHTRDESDKLLKKHIENEYETPGEAAEHLANVYPAPKGVNPEEYKKHMEQGIDAYSKNLRDEPFEKAMTGNMFWKFDKSGTSINFPPKSLDMSESLYVKLRRMIEEQSDMPRYARVTPEETPDYYGQLERERAEGRSNEEPPSRTHTPESVTELLNRAHQAALARTATAFGKGGKHSKQDPFHMIGHYADELASLHTRIMGDVG